MRIVPESCSSNSARTSSAISSSSAKSLTCSNKRWESRSKSLAPSFSLSPKKSSLSDIAASLYLKVWCGRAIGILVVPSAVKVSDTHRPLGKVAPSAIDESAKLFRTIPEYTQSWWDSRQQICLMPFLSNQNNVYKTISYIHYQSHYCMIFK